MKNFFTISKQYDAKQDRYIFIVRILRTVKRSVFETLTDCAASRNGRYSSFIGEKGFVFLTQNDANEFGDDLINLFDMRKQRNGERKKFSCSPAPDEARQEEIDSDMTQAGANLTRALAQIFQKEGIESLTDDSILDQVNRLKVFDLDPTSGFIFRTLVKEGYGLKLLKTAKLADRMESLIKGFRDNFGFEEKPARLIFARIAEAMSWEASYGTDIEAEEDTAPEEEEAGLKTGKPQEKPAKREIKKWLKKEWFVFKENGKFGIVNGLGETVFDAVFDFLGDEDFPFSADDLFLSYRIGNKWGIISISTGKKTSPVYEAIGIVSEGLCDVVKNGLHGFVDDKMNEVIKCQFNDASLWDSSGRCVVKKKSRGNNCYVIDREGRTVIPAIHRYMTAFRNGYAVVYDRDSNYYGLIDRNGKFVIPMNIYVPQRFSRQNPEKTVKSLQSDDTANLGLIVDSQDNTLVYSDAPCKRLITELPNGDFIVENDDREMYHTCIGLTENFLLDARYGVIDSKGKIVIPCSYSEMIPSPDNKYLMVCLKKRWGVILCDGTLVLDTVYKDVTVLEDDLAIVTKGKKSGLISLSPNKTLLPVKYPLVDILPQVKGSFLVRAEEGAGIFSAAKGWIVSPHYEDLEGCNNSPLLKFRRNGKWGLMTMQEEPVADAVFDWIIEIKDSNLFLGKRGSTVELGTLSGEILHSAEMPQIIHHLNSDTEL